MAQPRALIISIGNNIGLTRLPALLARAGYRIEVFGDRNVHVIRSSKVDRVHKAPAETVNLNAALESLLTEPWDLIIPGDDVTLRHLATDGRSAFLRALPVDTTRVSPGIVRDKGPFTDWLLASGLPTPATARAQSADQAIAWWAAGAFPRVIMKPVEGAGGKGIFIPTDAEDLRRQWEPEVREYLVQEFVTGRTFVAEWIMRGGVPLAAALSHKCRSRGAFGFSTERHFHEHAPALDLARAVGAATGFDGFGGADLIQCADGSFQILEVHFRPTSCLHLCRDGGWDFAAALRGDTESAHRPRARRPIPLFPELIYVTLQRQGLLPAMRQLLRPGIWARMMWDDPGVNARHWWKLRDELRKWRRQRRAPHG